MQIAESITSPQTLRFGLEARQRKRRGERVISLGLGEPEFDTPEHIKQAAKDALDAGFTRYGAANGLPELRESIARKLNAENGLAARADEIIVAPGAKNALFLACAAVLRPGDEVVNLTPCYVSNDPILRLAEPQALVRNLRVPVETGKLPIAQLQRMVGRKTKLIVINSPNNPTGWMLGKEDVQALRRVVREHRTFLLSDEIYERIRLESTPHISLGAFEDIRDKVITVNGFSKAYSMTGWRIGYVHAGGEVRSLILKLHAQLNTNTAEFIQKAALAALEGPQDHLAAFLADLRQRKTIYTRLLAENEHLTGSDPQGGFFGFVNISATSLASDEFALQLLKETGVVVIPGISFGVDYDNYCRLSLVNETPLVEEGLRRIDAFVKERAERQ